MTLVTDHTWEGTTNWLVLSCQTIAVAGETISSLIGVLWLTSLVVRQRQSKTYDKQVWTTTFCYNITLNTSKSKHKHHSNKIFISLQLMLLVVLVTRWATKRFDCQTNVKLAVAEILPSCNGYGCPLEKPTYQLIIKKRPRHLRIRLTLLQSSTTGDLKWIIMNDLMWVRYLCMM